MNECAECGSDFCSLAAFDEHIFSSPSEPTFDCMTVAELVSEGWEKDARGRWTSPKSRASADALREHFSAVSVSA
jgi:hypothetical protein